MVTFQEAESVSRWSEFPLVLALAVGAAAASPNPNHSSAMPPPTTVACWSTVAVARIGPFIDPWDISAPTAAMVVSAPAMSLGMETGRGIDAIPLRLDAADSSPIANGAGHAGNCLSEEPVDSDDPPCLSVSVIDTATPAVRADGARAVAAPVPAPPGPAVWPAALAVVAFLAARRRARG